MDLPSNWLKEYPYDDTVAILTAFARAHAAQSGPFAEELISALDRNDLDWLCRYEPKYHPDVSPDCYRNCRQAVGFFQKFEPAKIGIDRELVAFTKFIEAETQCHATNIRLRQLAAGEFKPSSAVCSVIHTAQRKIASCLGDVPSYGSLKFRFGPGANTTVKARTACPRVKLGAPLACSNELANSVKSLLDHMPAWASNYCQGPDSRWEISIDDDEVVIDAYSHVTVEIQSGSLQFVPKNAKTYRSIVVEPILNSVAQKGVGTYLKRRLRDSGCDLGSQERNKLLAWEGSISNSLSTVDLSSASDTISKEVVATLLPLDWYTFLSRFRTGRVVYQGTEMVLEKFSSMGNAYTFELESLIFWGLTRAVCEHLRLDTGKVSVYGDDIILPSEGYSLLVEVLSTLGFSVNSSKSFAEGPFRESCGADWFLGHDIRPYYQKSLITAETLFTLHNFYARRFEFDMCKIVKSWIHPSLHLYGPDGYGDGHLIGDWSSFQRKTFKDRGWGGVLFETFARKNAKLLGCLPGDRVLPAYSVYVSEQSNDPLDGSAPTNHFVVRGHTGYKRVSIYTLSVGVFRRF